MALRKILTGCAGVLLVAMTPEVSGAQDAQLLVPKPQTARDPHGVDLIGGGFSHSPATLSIGPKDGGLSFQPVITDRGRWTHNFLGAVVEWCEWNYDANMCEWERGLHRTVTLGESHAVVFEELPDGRWTPMGGQSATLSGSGGNWTFVAHDGTVATFSSPTVWEYSGDGGPGFKQTSLAALRTLARPNGLVLTYHYRVNASGAYTLSSVTSNTGYQLFLESDTSFLPEITKAIMLNNVVESCDPTAPTCNPVGPWPTMTFARGADFRSATDALGRTTYYNYGQPGSNARSRVIGVRLPGRASGYNMTLLYRQYVAPPKEGVPYVEKYGPVSSVTTDDGVWNYQNSFDSNIRTVINPLGESSEYEIIAAQEFPHIISVTNGLSSIYRNSYRYIPDIGVLLLSVTQPEGNKVVYSYDARGNVTEERVVSKTPGTPADVVRRATYPATCDNPVTCNLPTSVTDARGGVTDYTYDAAGNLLTVTGPAPTPGAPRPQTRYQWEQRYAWYKQNGSGAITQAPSPVWVQVGSSQCMTGATC